MNATTNNANGNQDGVLERFMEEMFDLEMLTKIGLLTKEMKGNYPAQAERIRQFFGYESIYEYGAHTTRCHISYVNPQPGQPFITEFKGWADE